MAAACVYVTPICSGHIHILSLFDVSIYSNNRISKKEII